MTPNPVKKSRLRIFNDKFICVLMEIGGSFFNERFYKFRQIELENNLSQIKNDGFYRHFKHQITTAEV